jgi:hypothetical protein
MQLGKDYTNVEYDTEHTGRFGFGFKHGSLRLGETAVIVSACSNTNTASLGILSIHDYKQWQRTVRESRLPAPPVVVQYATLDLNTLRPAAGCSTQASYDTVLASIDRLTGISREMLMTLINDKVQRDRDVYIRTTSVTSFTRVFISHLRRNERTQRYELMDVDSDLRLEGTDGDHLLRQRDNHSFHRNESNKLMRPPLDYSLREYLLLLRYVSPATSTWSCNVCVLCGRCAVR